MSEGLVIGIDSLFISHSHNAPLKEKGHKNDAK